jgi:hypothetical protein
VKSIKPLLEELQTGMSNYLFHIVIRDGYSFRNTIGTIKTETFYTTMILSPSKIEISFMNTLKCAIHCIELDTKEFPYFYNAVDENGKLLPEYPLTFETTEMFNTTKNIGRKESLTICGIHGDNKIIILSGTAAKEPGMAGAEFVKLLPKEPLRYRGCEDYGDEPNVRVLAKTFAEICSKTANRKCDSLEIGGQKTAVTLRGLFANLTEAFVKHFTNQNVPLISNTDNVNPSNIAYIDNMIKNMKFNENGNEHMNKLTLNVIHKEDLMKTRVPVNTVKALSKIHNISPTGTMLKFYFAEGCPTKIVSPIGTYGTYAIYLR